MSAPTRTPALAASVAPAIPDAAPIVDAIIRRGDSPHTRRAYALDLRAYSTWLGSEGLAWQVVTPDDLDRYRPLRE